MSDNIRDVDPEDLEAVVAAGKKIYEQRYKDALEKNYRDKFAVIEIRSESVTIGESALDVMDKAQERNPNGVFYLIRIGHDAAYEIRSPR